MNIKEGTFRIIVRTSQPKTEIAGYDEGRKAYRMNVKARPEKNLANKEIVSYLRKTLKKDIRIISGLSSKEKLIKAA